MTDRAESVLAAVATAVTGLSTTGARVVRGRVYPADTAPALSVDMGAEQPESPPNVAFQDELLDVEITAFVQPASGTSVDTMLNQIRSEVYAAILADRTLGESFVINTVWQGRTAAQRSGTGSAPAAEQTMMFRVWYRHSYTSTEA